MTEPRACPECLRRAQLLARLAPYIERSASDDPGRSSPQLLHLGNEELVRAVAPRAADELLTAVASLPERRLYKQLAEASLWAICRHSERFPVGLRDDAAAPWALFGRGDPALLGRVVPRKAVAVVGSRRATTLWARGCPSARSRACRGGDRGGERPCLRDRPLRSPRRAGNGADRRRARLRRRRRLPGSAPCVVEADRRAGPRALRAAGAWRWSFPARNRIVAALTGMTVVVEAVERSGSMITADLAVELGRELGAVPGPVGSRASAAPNRLIAQGAHLVRDGRDVLSALGWRRGG